MEPTDLYEKLTDEELDILVPFYTNLIPHKKHSLDPVTERLGARGLLYIYDRNLVLNTRRVRPKFRYHVQLSIRGCSVIFVQDPIQLVLCCVRCGMTSEALEFMNSVPNELLSEILVCGDATVRKQARWRLQCTGENGISAP